MTQQTLSTVDYFSTADLGLATTLSMFYPIEVIDRTNPHKAHFLFRRNKNLDRFVEEYWQSHISIEPKAYFNQLRVIKTRLYEAR